MRYILDVSGRDLKLIRASIVNFQRTLAISDVAEFDGLIDELDDCFLTVTRQKKEQLKSKRTALKKTTKVLAKLEDESQKPTNEGKIVTEDDLSLIPKAVQDEINKGSHVVFHANEGPQTQFLAADEKDVLYGGAAGGGKSYAMLVDPLRYAHKKAHRALILRRSMPA